VRRQTKEEKGEKINRDISQSRSVQFQGACATHANKREDNLFNGCVRSLAFL
jgi:hypothetical protein